MSESNLVNMEALASLCKRRGFIYQTSEPYGGLNGFWDYGPLGCELKRNIREAWWRSMVYQRDDVVGLDSAIVQHPRVWEASGHLEGFTDPMVDCRECRRRFRADQLCEEQGTKLLKDTGGRLRLPEGVSCPACGAKGLTDPRSFNLMFKTFVGPVEDESAVAHLRPETAQGIFVNFPTILNTTRVKVPFGIAQIGKAFRNEINPRNFTFRSREFEQMELEYFVRPGTDKHWHEYWVNERLKWYAAIGLPEGRLHRYVYAADELAHYASACVDITYEFPFGTQELEGIAARGDYDLRRHQQFSGKSFEYFDGETNERYLPHVVEPSAGVDRIALALLCEAYREEWVPGAGIRGDVLAAMPGGSPPEGYEPRTVLRFAPCMAPFKAAVFPLLKNKPALVDRARRMFETLRRRWLVFYDEQGAIGRRYRRQDEIGTPFGITVDFQTLEDDTVTIRDRDTMAQVRVPAMEVADRIAAALEMA